VEPVII
jgi:hypothetical protein